MFPLCGGVNVTLPRPSALPSIQNGDQTFVLQSAPGGAPSFDQLCVKTAIWLKNPLSASGLVRVAALIAASTNVDLVAPDPMPALARVMSSSNQPKTLLPVIAIAPNDASRQNSTNPPVPGVKIPR